MVNVITKHFTKKYAVLYRESERGWGSDFWIRYFDSEQEAKEAVVDCNKDLPDVAPDYYIVAEYKGLKEVETDAIGNILNG